MCGRVLRENMGSNSRARRVIGDSGEKKEIIFGEFKQDLENLSEIWRKLYLMVLECGMLFFGGTNHIFFQKQVAVKVFFS